MNIRTKPSTGTAPAAIATEEWSARVDLAAVYRLVAHHSWDDVIYNHFSMRVPGEDGRFLIEAAWAPLDRGDRQQSGQGRHARRPRRAGGGEAGPASPCMAACCAAGRTSIARFMSTPGPVGMPGLKSGLRLRVPGGGALLRSHRVSSLRGRHRGFRRARAAGGASRRRSRHDHAQSRGADGRQDHARGLTS